MRKVYFYFCAWDRACELYAQLNGLVTDYGAGHFARCGHLRYGRDYTKNSRKYYATKKDGRADYEYSFKGWFL